MRIVSLFFLVHFLVASASFDIINQSASAIIDGQISYQPFLGGLNYPRIEWVDLNEDGKNELFVLDEDGCIRLYEYVFVEDNSFFEVIDTSYGGLCGISWFNFRDFNQDGSLEFACQSLESSNEIQVYSIINDEFNLIGSVLDSNSSPVISDASMVPTFADIDGDGDYDFFTGNIIGTVTLYENVGLENNLPIFEFQSFEWQDIWIVGPSAQNRHGASAINFIDIDLDGDLDLFVCRYVQWSRTIDLELAFTLNGTDRAYGPPTNYQGAHCRLFENDGRGAFRDVSAERGIEVVNPATNLPLGKALALTICDFDRDGWLDVMVANDTVQNFMFHNQEGAFVEIGASSGVAFDRLGAATGAMGIDVAEPRGDARLAIAVANFANEASSLYAAEDPDHPLRFTDMSGAEGLGTPSRQRLSFGLCFFDVDMDGREDLLQINGHLEEEIAEVQASQSYRQPAQLFWNCGHDAKRCLALAPDDSVGDLANPLVGRGAGFADFDGDGDLDLAVAQAGAPAVVYRNDFPAAASLRVLPDVGDQPGMAIGAEITLTVDGVTRRRRIAPTRSYLTQVPAEAWFGLGSASASGTGTVSWIGGKTTSFTFEGAGTVIVSPE